MYRLLEIRGVEPEKTKKLAESEDAEALIPEYLHFEKMAFANGYTLTELRYAVRAV